MAKRGGLMTHRDPRQRFDEFYDDRRHGDRPDNSPIFMVLLATGDRHSEQLVHTTCHHVMLKRTLILCEGGGGGEDEEKGKDKE